MAMVMGVAVMVLFPVPWLDRSPVRSIRYRPGWNKWLYAIFIFNFLVLGYLGIKPPSEIGTLVSQAGGDELVRVFRAQQAGARRLPHYVSFPIGHKTGDFPPVVANDVGMAYHPSGPIVVSFFLNEIRGNYGEAEDAMGRVMQRIAEYHDR